MSQQKIKFLLHNVNAITGSFKHYGTHLDGIKSLDAGMKTGTVKTQSHWLLPALCVFLASPSQQFSKETSSCSNEVLTS